MLYNVGSLKSMDLFDGLSENVAISPVGRKRKREVCEREKDKRRRHSGGGKIPKIACDHTAADGGFCQADRLTDDAIVLNHTQLYGCATKAQQDEMVLRLMTLTKPQRVRLRPGQDVRQRDKSMSVKYPLMTSDAREQLQVCKATFIGVLG